MASRATVPTTKEESLRVMDTNWLRNELIRIVKEARGRREGEAAFNERAQLTIRHCLDFNLFVFSSPI